MAHTIRSHAAALACVTVLVAACGAVSGTDTGGAGAGTSGGTDAGGRESSMFERQRDQQAVVTELVARPWQLTGGEGLGATAGEAIVFEFRTVDTSELIEAGRPIPTDQYTDVSPSGKFTASGDCAKVGGWWTVSKPLTVVLMVEEQQDLDCDHPTPSLASALATVLESTTGELTTDPTTQLALTTQAGDEVLLVPSGEQPSSTSTATTSG
jgi:hypothetical protein